MITTDSHYAEITRREVLIKKPFVSLPSNKELVEGVFCEILLPNGKTTDGKGAVTYLRQGNGKDLLILFNGGGMAWDKKSCAYPTTFSSLFGQGIRLYIPNMNEIAVFTTFLAPTDMGILDIDKRKSPFFDWNTALFQYASADFHVGNGNTDYIDISGKKRKIYFDGYEIFKAALQETVKRFPSPERLLIVGGSAGAFGVAALAGEIIDKYSSCKNITVLCDSAVDFRDNWKYITKDFWCAPKHICESVHTKDIAGDWLCALSKKYGERVKILYACSVRDAAFAMFRRYERDGSLEVTEKECDIVNEWLHKQYVRLAQECPNIHYFYNNYAMPDGSAGTVHCTVIGPHFYQYKTDGVSVFDWAWDAVGGKLHNIGVDLLGKH